MAGFDRLLWAVGLLAVCSSVTACGASAPPSDAARSGNARTTTPPVQLKAGDPAPQFSLPGSDGKMYSLADYRGKQAVVLAWFVKAFTGP